MLAKLVLCYYTFLNLLLISKAPLDGELSGDFGSVSVPATSETDWDTAKVWRIFLK